MYFSNRTTGASVSLTFSAPSGTKLVGNCAEWIVEAPTVNGSQSMMPDYGQVFFNNCEGYDGSAVNGGSGNNINMYEGSTETSEGIIITPTVIECEYVGALP